MEWRGFEFEVFLRYLAAVRAISGQYWRRHPDIDDPTDQDDAIDETALRVATYEQQKGKARSLAGLIRHTFHQVVQRRLGRSNYYRLQKMRVYGDAHLAHTKLADSSAKAAELFGEYLESLNDRERRILHLRFFVGLNVREISDELGISKANVYKITHRAIERLRVLYRDKSSAEQLLDRND